MPMHETTMGSILAAEGGDKAQPSIDEALAAARLESEQNGAAKATEDKVTTEQMRELVKQAAQAMHRQRVLELVAKLPQQGGTLWSFVEQVERYLETGNPLATSGGSVPGDVFPPDQRPDVSVEVTR